MPFTSKHGERGCDAYNILDMLNNTVNRPQFEFYIQWRNGGPETQLQYDKYANRYPTVGSKDPFTNTDKQILELENLSSFHMRRAPLKQFFIIMFRHVSGIGALTKSKHSLGIDVKRDPRQENIKTIETELNYLSAYTYTIRHKYSVEVSLIIEYSCKEADQYDVSKCMKQLIKIRIVALKNRLPTEKETRRIHI